SPRPLLLADLPRYYLCSSLFLSTAPSRSPISTLSLHDALPISPCVPVEHCLQSTVGCAARRCLQQCGGDQQLGRRRHRRAAHPTDRKSTRLNSSHVAISYAVFCLKKKKKKKNTKHNTQQH